MVVDVAGLRARSLIIEWASASRSSRLTPTSAASARAVRTSATKRPAGRICSICAGVRSSITPESLGAFDDATLESVLDLKSTSSFILGGMTEPNRPVAVITGASQGLGLALATELASRGWSLVVDARRGDRPRRRDRGAARRAAPGRRRGRGRPGAPARARRRRRRARRGPAARQQRQHAGREPAAGVRGPRPGDVPPAAGGQPGRPAGPDRRRCCRSCAGTPASSSTSARTPPSRPTRPGAATGRPRPGSTTPRGSWPPRSRGCGSTPSTPATCGRRCTRTRSPARTSPTGPSPASVVPALLELVDGDLPGGRYRASDLAVSTLGVRSDASPPPRSRRRPAAWRATRSGSPW